MAVRAENDPKYSRRFLIMGVLAIGFAIYCLYDGFIGYPAKRLRGFEDYRTFYKLEENAALRGVSLEEFEASASEEQRKQWNDFAYESGIPSRGDVIVQFVMAGGSAAAGLLLLSIPWRARGRWIESTDTGIQSSWGQSFNFDQVQALNKRQWRRKGIAKVTYLEGGRKRRFVIDDYKFDRYPTDAILYELEQHIDPSLITGGPPEEPPPSTGPPG